MSIFVAVTLVVSAVVIQFKPEPYKQAFLAIAFGFAAFAALLVAYRIGRMRRLFEYGLVLNAHVIRHDRTELHAGKVHTPSSLLYEYEFHGQHFQHKIPYYAGSPAHRRFGQKLRGKKMDVSTWLLALSEGDNIDILISEASPEKSYIVQLYTGVPA